MIKVVLADDHALVRKGIELIVQLEDDIQLIGQVQDGEALMRELPDWEADVLLLDLDMPKLNGFTIIPGIRKEYPDLKIIVLTVHDESLYGETARKLGVHGYIHKGDFPQRLTDGLRTVAKGGEIFNEELHPQKGQRRKKIKLSRREVEVMKMLSQGMANKEIAHELNISDKTVSTYKTRILTKIGGKSVVDIVNFTQRYPEVIRK